MASTTFTYETGEIDTAEGVWLVGDFLIELETNDDGHSFSVVDVISMRRQIVGTLRQAVVEWVEGDTAPAFPRHNHKSLVRKAYETYLAERTPDDEADDRGCYEFHQRSAA